MAGRRSSLASSSASTPCSAIHTLTAATSAARIVCISAARRSRMAFSTERLTHQPTMLNRTTARIGQTHSCLRIARLLIATVRTMLRALEATALAALDVNLA